MLALRPGSPSRLHQLQAERFHGQSILEIHHQGFLRGKASATLEMEKDDTASWLWVLGTTRTRTTIRGRRLWQYIKYRDAGCVETS